MIQSLLRPLACAVIHPLTHLFHFLLFHSHEDNKRSWDTTNDTLSVSSSNLPYNTPTNTSITSITLSQPRRAPAFIGDAVKSFQLQEHDRVFMILQFLSWEIFKFLIPLLYLISVYILVNGPNAQWMGGLGIVVYEWTFKMDAAHLKSVTEKILVLVIVDAAIFVCEILALRPLRIDLWSVFKKSYINSYRIIYYFYHHILSIDTLNPSTHPVDTSTHPPALSTHQPPPLSTHSIDRGVLCFSCKKLGHCLCFLLTFMPLNQVSQLVSPIHPRPSPIHRHTLVTQ